MDPATREELAAEAAIIREISPGGMKSNNYSPVEKPCQQLLDEEKYPESIPQRLSTDPAMSADKMFPETDLAHGIVGWDGQDDPANPHNFPSARKWTLLALISAMTFISPLASSMFSPALGYMAVDFKVTNDLLLSFSVTIFLLGYAFGPLLLGPLSEIYGRRTVLSVSNWFFVIWQIGCALSPNISCLIVTRLLTGIGGAGAVTLGAGVIADLFPREQRGIATSAWTIGPLIGPVVGPICGGFIGETIGWRWIYWVLLISRGVTAFGIDCLNRETYAPVLIRWKTARLMKEFDRTDLRSAYCLETRTDSGSQSAARIIRQGMRRPLLLLFKSPIVFLLSTYMACLYALLYLLFTTVPTVFEIQYGFSPGLTGLSFLGIGLGFMISSISIACTSDKIIIKLTAQNNRQYEPEMRLPTMIFFSCLSPISFFWYGWCAAKDVHWVVPIVSLIPFGIGLVGVFMPIQTYTIDCYPEYAASANASLTTLRSLVGAVLPLAGSKLFANLGLGWGSSLLGFVALAFVPVPVFFHRYGKVIREKFPINLN